jgi:hypothetical protein
LPFQGAGRRGVTGSIVTGRSLISVPDFDAGGKGLPIYES